MLVRVEQNHLFRTVRISRQYFAQIERKRPQGAKRKSDKQSSRQERPPRCPRCPSSRASQRRTSLASAMRSVQARLSFSSRIRMLRSTRMSISLQLRQTPKPRDLVHLHLQLDRSIRPSKSSQNQPVLQSSAPVRRHRRFLIPSLQRSQSNRLLRQYTSRARAETTERPDRRITQTDRSRPLQQRLTHSSTVHPLPGACLQLKELLHPSQRNQETLLGPHSKTCMWQGSRMTRTSCYPKLVLTS